MACPGLPGAPREGYVAGSRREGRGVIAGDGARVVIVGEGSRGEVVGHRSGPLERGRVVMVKVRRNKVGWVQGLLGMVGHGVVTMVKWVMGCRMLRRKTRVVVDR